MLTKTNFSSICGSGQSASRALASATRHVLRGCGGSILVLIAVSLTSLLPAASASAIPLITKSSAISKTYNYVKSHADHGLWVIYHQNNPPGCNGPFGGVQQWKCWNRVTMVFAPSEASLFPATQCEINYVDWGAYGNAVATKLHVVLHVGDC